MSDDYPRRAADLLKPGSEPPDDPVAKGRDFTQQCHELAPKLYGMVFTASGLPPDNVAESWESLDLQTRDAHAQLAAWHLRTVLQVQEETARRVRKQMGSDRASPCTEEDRSPQPIHPDPITFTFGDGTHVEFHI